MSPNRLASLAMAALLLPLLAACGGASPTVVTAPTAAPIVRPPAEQPIVEPPSEPKQQQPELPAAAPTAAPAATSMPPAERAPADSTTDGAPAPIAPAGEAAAPPVAHPPRPHPTPPPIPIDQQQYTPLKAGEVDDNRDFVAYLNYLQGFYGYGVTPVDVTERVIVTVINERQQPVLDARVRVYAGQQQVFEGRTIAGGQTIFFPRSLDLSANDQTLQIVVEKGQARVSERFTRGLDERPVLVLSGAEALPQTPRLDVLFLLDATGSMGDEIGSIQTTITDIAARIDRFQPRPNLRFGLVSYRDRGDDYVTRLETDFTGDVWAFREALMRVSAGGGGDTPEDLNSGLAVAVRQMSWSSDAVRLVFLVADAPAHLDYGQDFDYIDGVREAVRQGVKIYPIGASNTDEVAEYQFRQLAQQTLASFIFLTYQPGQNGGTPGDTTTMDVNPQQFTAERLDDLVVQVVERELREAVWGR